MRFLRWPRQPTPAAGGARRQSRQSPYCGLGCRAHGRSRHRAGAPQLRGAGGAEPPAHLDAFGADRPRPALPRPTVVRLLHTLIALGYAARVSREQGYRLTDRVLGLSESIRFVDHLVDAAIPHMRRFTAEHGWPLYLATLERRRHHHPPFDRAGEPDGVRGRGPQHAAGPLLISALGRAWLAFCPRRGAARHPARHRRADAAPGGGARRPRSSASAATATPSPQPPRPTRLHGMAVPIRRGEPRAGQPVDALPALGHDRGGGRAALRPPACHARPRDRERCQGAARLLAGPSLSRRRRVRAGHR